MDPYLVLLRVGFTLPLLLPIARCALTAPFHPYLIQYKAVYFLRHWPSAHAAQPLAGTLPVGARTFLDIIRYRNCLANSHNIPYWIPGQKTMSGTTSFPPAREWDNHRGIVPTTMMEELFHGDPPIQYRHVRAVVGTMQLPLPGPYPWRIAASGQA